MATRMGGDFIGFSYNGYHSSDLGILRTSSGSRYKVNLLPTMQDKTATRAGVDGTMYWGSNYTQTPFSVNYAFDGLTQEELGNLRVVFGDKGVHELVFDETPYKVYKAKVTGTAQIEYLAFDEGETRRLYKGNGTLTFTCYDPYARNPKGKKFLDKFDDENKDEWKDASRMLELQNNYDKLSGAVIPVYNAGDIETHFKLTVPFLNGKINCTGIYITGSELLFKNGIEQKGSDAAVVIDTAINLLEGVDGAGSKTGNIYNEYLTGGDFFKLPKGESQLTLNNGANSGATIEYDYLYY